MVALRGIEIHVERRGAGPRLLFLNGSGQTLERARPLLDVFARRFEVLAHDQRGLGRSSVPPGPYTMADYAADAAAVLDHAGWDRARVAGVSFGGMVAQELAVTWPGRVERLALLCTSPGGAGGASYPLHELADLPPDERADATIRLTDSRFTPAWLADHPSDRALADMIAARGRDGRSPEQRRGEREQLGARRHHDVTDRLGAVTCPTLVACGRYDGIAPAANSEAIAERIPGSELRIYDGGHPFFAQDRAALPEILDFLAG
ncbi:MAG TPA: alpha/beta fold hydrolase [Acidimicrobiales bacterium]|nr:alpha/beta fold hydrolase [Acidimicrobiales bacterium]